MASPEEHPEKQYLNLVRSVLERGEPRTDRTGTGTLSVFGASMRFSLREGFPLLTTKRVFWKAVCEELLWFIRGDTDARHLSEKGVRIWDANSSRAFLDSMGFLDREEGDLGPIYGFQWRHWGAEYGTAKDDYQGKGVDQLRQVIELIKTEPSSRRIILSAWNPTAIPKMALPPCHVMAQFYVSGSKELSCQLYQRSADLGLGVPFNIASYSLLTHMIAQVCGLAVGDFVHVLGDAHVYANHVEALTDQIEREPRSFPTLKLNSRITEIDDFTIDDVELEGYRPHPSVPMKMAV